MHIWIGFLSSFLASAVEVVEAVTLVLAAGVTRGWRSTWIGVVSAAVALAVLVLVFGLQWLRKAIMRYTGLKELHDESRIYQREVAELQAAPGAQAGMD